MLISFPIFIHGKCFQRLDESHNLFVTCWLLLIQHRVFNHEYILFTDIQRKHFYTCYKKGKKDSRAKTNYFYRTVHKFWEKKSIRVLLPIIINNQLCSCWVILLLCVPYLCVGSVYIILYILWLATIGSITHIFPLYWLSDYPQQISFFPFIYFL